MAKDSEHAQCKASVNGGSNLLTIQGNRPPTPPAAWLARSILCSLRATTTGSMTSWLAHTMFSIRLCYVQE